MFNQFSNLPDLFRNLSQTFLIFPFLNLTPIFGEKLKHQIRIPLPQTHSPLPTPTPSVRKLLKFMPQIYSLLLVLFDEFVTCCQNLPSASGVHVRVLDDFRQSVSHV